MIVEGLLTTLDADGQVHLAPMGPVFSEDPRQMELRPFAGSHTFANLRRSGQAVFHTTDDVLLLARCAVGELAGTPAWRRAPEIAGAVLNDACRWWALSIESWDTSQERAAARAQVVAQGEQRAFLGFNRAKHAVVEAAILATRLRLLPRAELLRQLAVWRPLVAKTGGPQEQEAWQFLERYFHHQGINSLE